MQVVAYHNLATALRMQGKMEEAATHYYRAMLVGPASAETRYNLACLFIAQGNTAKAIVYHRSAVALKPDFTDALTGLAWILATDGDDSLRNGTEAVRLASKACELTDQKDAAALGALSAAYAEVGRMDDAIRAAQTAAELASARGNETALKFLNGQLESYGAGRPYRSTPTNQR
jgi:Flp pilus assembly protein TadD